MPQQGQKMGEPADGIGQPHDTQILVRNMRDFVAEHAGQLAEREATQQTVGQRDGRVMLRTGGEGVDDPAGHVVRYRHGRQPGPRRQFAQHSPKIGRFIRVQRACAIQPQGQPGSRRRFEQQGEPRGRQRQPQSAVTQQQAAGDGGNPEQGQHQQRGLQAIEPAMPRAGSLRVAPITMAHLGFPQRPGHRARAAASKSPRGPASRLRAPRSWRGWSPGRGSRTCAQGDQPDQDHRLDLDDAIAAQGHPHDGMLKLHGDEQRHDHAEHGLEDLVIERIERIDDQQAEDDRDQLQQRDHDDHGNDCGQRERDHLFEALVERHHCPLGTKCFDRVRLLFLHRHSSQF